MDISLRWLFLIPFLPGLGTLIFVTGTFLFSRLYHRIHTLSKTHPDFILKVFHPSFWIEIQTYLKEILFSVLWIYRNILYRLIRPKENFTHINNTKCPIFLVHGYGDTPYSWIFVLQELKKRGWNHLYPIALKNALCSIKEHAKTLAEKVNRIAGLQRKVRLIGFSMGGLVAAQCAEFELKPNRVDKVIAIASPFKGTYVAKTAFGLTAREMEPGSGFLLELMKKMKTNSNTHYTFIASEGDNFLVPWEAACPEVPEAEYHVIPKRGHATLLFSKEVPKLIDEKLTTVDESILAPNKIEMERRKSI